MPLVGFCSRKRKQAVVNLLEINAVSVVTYFVYFLCSKKSSNGQGNNFQII
jgi:hypothetical protein